MARQNNIIKGILCDLDGTLVDSAEDIRTALNGVLAEHGLSALTLAQIKGMIGDGSPALITRALAATGGAIDLSERILRDYTARYEENVALHTRPYAGVRETLTRLKSRNLKLGVVTNKLYATTTGLLKKIGLLDAFDTVIGGDSTPRRKPDPMPLLAALDALSLDPENAIMIGDNYHDVHAAHGAGLKVAIVTYGYSHKPYAELGADHLLQKFSDIESIVGEAALDR